MKMLRLIILLILVVFCSKISQATVIDFSGLSGSNGDAFTAAYIEDGFILTPLSGNWYEAHLFGNPVPSLYAGPINSPSTSMLGLSLLSGGDFNFLSVDWSSNTTENGDVQIKGYLDGILNFAYYGFNFLDFNTFETMTNKNTGTLFDYMTFTLIPDTGVTSMNIDNINVVAVVPEPSTVILFGAGLAGLAAMGIRRRKS